MSWSLSPDCGASATMKRDLAILEVANRQGEKVGLSTT
jgi:hypothetical protein